MYVLLRTSMYVTLVDNKRSLLVYTYLLDDSLSNFPMVVGASPVHVIPTEIPFYYVIPLTKRI